MQHLGLQGTLPSQLIEELVHSQALRSECGRVEPKQIQPSSLDLKLSAEAYQLPGSILPLPHESIRALVRAFARKELDLSKPTLLDRGKVYLVRLQEHFNLKWQRENGVVPLAAYTNNKSSTGRIDLGTRTLCDFNPRYDFIPSGYQGELWLEIIPKSFDVILQQGLSLNQAIFYAQRSILKRSDLEELSGSAPLLFDKKGLPLGSDFKQNGETHSSSPDAWGKNRISPQSFLNEGILMTLDLEQELVGYGARKTSTPIDLSLVGEYNPSEFFEAIEQPARGQLSIEQGRFYIFSTAEYIRIPPNYAAEMLPYDTSAGEFRAHYAGFFDPGFGYGLEGEEKGTPAVLEVRAYEDDLLVRHGQPICRMAYESLIDKPKRLYHASIGSNYTHQRGPFLSKFFRTNSL